MATPKKSGKATKRTSTSGAKSRSRKSTKASARVDAKEKGISKKKTTTRRVAAGSTSNLAAELLYGPPEKAFPLVNRRTKAVERVISRDEMEFELSLRTHELNEQHLAASMAMAKFSRWIKGGMFGPNVSCAVGFRRKFGHIVSPLRYGIDVHVPYKVSARNLAEWPTGGPAKKAGTGTVYSVPSQVDGVLTKVCETQAYRTDVVSLTTSTVPKSGLVRIKATKKLADISTSPAPKLSTTEVIGGLPTVETNLDDWGTFGIAVAGTPGARAFGLVNAHFADGSMVQPALKPSASDVRLWQIGVVPSGKKFEGDVGDDSSDEKYYVDAAVIELNRKRSFVLNLVQDFADEPFLYASSYLRRQHPNTNRTDLFKKVYKFGARTQERIEGFIESTEEKVPYEGRTIGKIIRARRNGTGTFTIGGDSGSVLVAPIYDLKTKRERFLVVGLCFAGLAGNKETLFACQFAAVIKALGLEMPDTLLRSDWEYAKPE